MSIPKTSAGSGKIYLGSNIIAEGGCIIDTPGIYHNSSLGLITINDGTNVITIADKNLGATIINGYGKYYQFGNCYGRTSTPSTTSSQLNVQGYGPNNYLNNSTFRTYSGSSATWIYTPQSYEYTQDLWGGKTNTNISKKGPCDNGYHIPSSNEFNSLLNVIKEISGYTSYSDLSNFLITYLKIPKAGYINNNGSFVSVGTEARLWTCTNPVITNPYAYYAMAYYEGWSLNFVVTGHHAEGRSIRPFKNEPVVPDVSREILYQSS